MIDIISNKKGGNNNVNTVIAIALLIFIVLIIVRIYKSMQGATKVIGQQIGDQTISIQTGVPAARIAYIRGVAQGLWDKAVTNYWVGYDYDENQFIAAINNMSTTVEVGLLNDFFKSVNKQGNDLKYVIGNSFDNNDIKRLKPTFYTYLLGS